MNLSLPSIPETRVRLGGLQVPVYLAMLFSCFGGTHNSGVSSHWPLDSMRNVDELGWHLGQRGGLGVGTGCRHRGACGLVPGGGVILRDGRSVAWPKRRKVQVTSVEREKGTQCPDL